MPGGIPTRFPWPTPSPSERKALLNRPSSSVSKLLRNQLFAFASTNSHGIARIKRYGPITKRMNLKYPVLETSESIEPNDNDFELNAISYTFSKIFQPELNNCFLSPTSFGDHELRSLPPSLWFPLKGERRNWEKRTLSLPWKISLSCGGIQEHKRRSEAETKGPNQQRSKTFLEKHCQTWLASL